MTPPLKPWQRTFRTIFQALLGLAVVLPVVVAQTGLEVDQLGWFAGFLAVCGLIARLMAVPQVEEFLRDNLPWLSATGDPKARHRGQGGHTVLELLAMVAIVVLVVWLFITLF